MHNLGGKTDKIEESMTLGLWFVGQERQNKNKKKDNPQKDTKLVVYDDVESV